MFLLLFLMLILGYVRFTPAVLGKGVRIGPSRIRAKRRVPRSVRKDVTIGPAWLDTPGTTKKRDYPTLHNLK